MLNHLYGRWHYHYGGGIIYICVWNLNEIEKAKETVKILKTPLDKSDELRDKYERKRITMRDFNKIYRHHEK